MSTIKNYSLSRREFIKATGIVGGGLLVGPGYMADVLAGEESADASVGQINPFIQINEAGDVVLFVPNAEMGQGAVMGLATLVAEELDTDVSKINYEFAKNDKVFAMPGSSIQITGGSATIRERFVHMREVAASARDIILLAASAEKNIPVSELRFSDSQIWHGEDSFELGEFVERAKSIPTPKNVRIKDSKRFKYIGKKTTPRNDAIAKVTGTAEFGIDVKIPGTKVAVVKSSPVIGGKVKSFDAKKAQSMPGVKLVMEVYNGVAVLADSYWQARTAVSTIDVEWELPKKLASFSSDKLEEALGDALEEKKGKESSKEGKGRKTLEKAGKKVSARYKAPYLAHATMEPMNCTVQISKKNMDVWLSTQAPGLAAQVASEYSGIGRDDIHVHTTFLGGGFGRRGAHDYVAQAVQVAKQSGEVVRLVWSREDDMQNGYYRPISWADYEAGIDESGGFETLVAKRAGPNVLPYAIDEGIGLFLPEVMPNGFVDWLGDRSYGAFSKLITDGTSVEGMHEDYDIANLEIRHVTVDSGLRCGPWRSVGHSYSAFFSECFIDEIAHELGKDPLALRMEYLKDERLKNVLSVAADKSGWGRPREGRYLGMAAQMSFKSYVAEIAEVSVVNGQIKVHKVTCVVDCGLAVNPDVVEAQMEGGIIFGLSAALHQAITLKDGAVQQTNFHDFPALRMNESPEIEVIIIESDEKPTGVGEPGTPPIAPAVANAVFAATGERLRELPLRLA
jgi:CO/xanthine dehydrogenase Mo-binding subunit